MIKPIRERIFSGEPGCHLAIRLCRPGAMISHLHLPASFPAGGVNSMDRLATAKSPCASSAAQSGGKPGTFAAVV
jgi:hypothetical protein